MSKQSEYTANEVLCLKYLKTEINHDLIPKGVAKAKVVIKIDSVSANGKIEKVTVAKGYNDTLDKEAIRVVRSIPSWSVYYKRGKIINACWYIPIIFCKD